MTTEIEVPYHSNVALLEAEIEDPVEVLQNKAATNKVAQYYLIVGSFKNKLNAERLVKELSFNGHTSFIYFNSENQFTYACVSSYANKDAAIQQSNTLKEDGVAVWVYSVR